MHDLRKTWNWLGTSAKTQCLGSGFVLMGFSPKHTELLDVSLISFSGLDGSTSASERERLINQFNDPSNASVWLFLLSTR